MMGYLLSSLILLALALPPAPKVQSCECATTASFKEHARTAPVLLAGRVVGGQLTKERGAASDVAAIDLEVVQVLRGSEERQKIRVWNQAAGTSCSLDMRRFKPLALIVVALDPDEPRSARLSDLARIQPEAADYVLSMCAEPWRHFSKQADLDKYIASADWK